MLKNIIIGVIIIAVLIVVLILWGVIELGGEAVEAVSDEPTIDAGEVEAVGD